MRASILKESALVITSWQPLGLIWLCHIQLMPGCRKFRAVRHCGPNIRNYIPELGEPWPSLGCSTRCAGHTEIPNRLSPATGSGLLLPPGKGSSLQAEERGLRRQTLRPKAAGRSAHPPSASPEAPAGSGGWGSGSRRTARVGDPHGGAACAGTRSRASGREGTSFTRGKGYPHLKPGDPTMPDTRLTFTSGREHLPLEVPPPRPLPAGICSS